MKARLPIDPAPCLLLAAGLLLTQAACHEPAEGQAPSPGPSIVLITIDTLRVDHLGCYGYPRDTSPVIDSIAARGVRFEDVLAQSSWTLPSMVSMMTGRYVLSPVGGVPAAETTLAEELRRAGYHTAAFVTNDLVGHKEGFDRGFDTYRVGLEVAPPGLDLEDPTLGMSGVQTDVALDWLEGSADEPFLVYMHYMEPHAPYGPPEGAHHFAADDRPPEPARDARHERALQEDPELRASAEAERSAMGETVDLYDSDVRYADASIGRLLEGLERLGKLQDTIVVVTADHGEGLFERRRADVHIDREVAGDPRRLTDTFLRGHSENLHAELVKAPLILMGPGIARGAVVEETVANVDVLPTVLDLVGLDPSGRDGRSLAPTLRAPDKAPDASRMLYSWTHLTVAVVQTELELKLVLPTEAGELAGIAPAMYDLGADPGEDVDLLAGASAEQLAIAADLERALAEAAERWRARDRAPELSDETRQKMRELGYIE